jgi:hypothetical protein
VEIGIGPVFSRLGAGVTDLRRPREGDPAPAADDLSSNDWATERDSPLRRQ